METLLQDARYALRGLRRSPGFTIVAILTLALGIGVNSAIFGVVNAVLYRPLPVDRPEQLVNIYGHQATSTKHETTSVPNFVDYERQVTTLSGLAGYTNFLGHATIDGASDLVLGELVTERYFSVLGVRPMLGRAFTAEENAAGHGLPVAILSYRLWQRRFGGDRAVLGRQFRMNGELFTVVGVAQETFGGMVPAVTAQMWLPAAMAEVVEPVGNNPDQRPGRPWPTRRAAGRALAVGAGTDEARGDVGAGARRVGDGECAAGARASSG
jgi:hypothetical protein